MRRSKIFSDYCMSLQLFLISKNKRRLSAEDYSLLSSALRPRLLNIIPIFLFFLLFSLAAETFWLTDEVSAATLEITIPASYAIDLNPGTGTTFGESKNQQIGIKTSGSFGYTLNIKPSDGTDLKSSSNTIKTITKSEGYDSSDGYKNSDEVNTWAYKPSKLNSVDNTKYLPFPSVETLLDKTDKNNDTANTYDLTIAAKVDNTLPSGTYSNNFVVSATANTVSYSITYNLNEGEWSGTSPQIGTTTENTIKLDSNEPTRDGFEFKGWCSIEPTGNDTTSPSCSGQTYEAGQDYTLTYDTNTLTLNAIWAATGREPVECRIIPNINQTGVFKDSRDDTSYNIARLADNRCWMTENLKIADKEISSTDSDMTNGTFNLPTSSTSGFSNYNVSNVYIDPTYGGYYTFYAATAGEGTNSQSGEASKSICPKGWRLPTQAELLNPPANFVLSGIYYLSRPGNQENFGNFWSSTANSTSSVRCTRLGRTSAETEIECGKNRGMAIRCIARGTEITDLKYLQDWQELTETEKSEVLSSMDESKSYQLIDIRDNNIYNVAKLKDGKLWMIENLRLGDNKLDNRTLTSNNTDITSTYQLVKQTPVNFNRINNGNYDADALYIDPDHLEYGGYYSWHTATAGTGTSSISSGDASSSICPSGWKIPTGGPNSELANLIIAYNGVNSSSPTKFLANPIPGFLLGGLVHNEGNGLIDQNSIGRYWSSTARDTNTAYGLYISVSTIGADSYNYKYFGRTIRCIART